MLWRHVREGDGMDKLAKIRLARSSAVRGSGHFNARFNEYYADFPFDWILFQEKDVDTQDAFGERFLDKPDCDCKPFFCRRVRRRLDARSKQLRREASARERRTLSLETFRSRGFQRMINFWCDHGESATSVRNERQHASFGKKLRAKKGAGAHSSGQRVAVEDFLSHLVTDHNVQFGDPERREL